MASIEFHKRIKKLRKSLGLTQEEMSAKIGIALRSYAAWEYAESTPSWETIQTMLKKLQIKSCELFEDHPASAMDEIPVEQLNGITSVIRAEINADRLLSQRLPGLDKDFRDLIAAFQELSPKRAGLVVGSLFEDPALGEKYERFLSETLRSGTKSPRSSS